MSAPVTLLMGRFARPGWYDNAPCRGLVRLFFAHDGDDGDKTEAIRVCGTCPYQADCLELALTVPVSQDHGIWGGTTAGERRTIRKRRRAERKLSA